MKRVLLGAAAALLLMTGCAGKENHFAPPQVITADGSTFSLPCEALCPTVQGDVPEDAARRLADAAGCGTSPEELDRIWFGENVFGVGLAAVVYCGAYPASLDAAQWELLEKIAASPEQFAPALSGESTTLPVSPYAQYASRIPENAYFDAMVEEIVTDLTEQQKCSRDKAFRMLYAEGVTIETPYSPEMQEIVDTVYADPLTFSETDTHFPQSACAVLDPAGSVLALGAGNQGNTAYNRAYRTTHPIGSSIKPLSVYAPALMQGRIGFSTIVEDAPVLGDGTSGAWPHNYNGIYEGDVTVTYALRQSKNTVPAALCREMTPHACWEFLQETLGFTTLTGADDSLPAMALGYLDRGVSLTELAAAYQIFGNGGVYHTPGFYTRVTDQNGRLLAEHRPAERQVMEPADAWIMNRLLYYNVCKDNGIAQAARLSDGSEVCGKTGTVDNGSNDTDRLFVGLTPEYTAAVWIGFDQAGAVIDLSHYNVPAAVWSRIMELADRQEKCFAPEPSVVEADFCTATGLLAAPGCQDTETGYYRAGAVPELCTLHGGAQPSSTIPSSTGAGINLS